MQNAIAMFARGHPPQPALLPMRRATRSILARLRDNIAILRTIGFDHATIAQTLAISEEESRVLSPKIYKPAATPRLTRHAIKALLNGRHAHIGGKAIPTRARNLLKIAAAYSWDELLEERGIGVSTAAEIQLWLEERGAALRVS